MGKRSRDRRREAERATRDGGSYAPRVTERPRPATPPKPGVDPAGFALGSLATVVERIASLEAERDRLILRARAQGAAWSEIGEALGCSPQAVQQRHARMGRA